ncbi:unnamed protein product, partial [Laminaria digitata]
PAERRLAEQLQVSRLTLRAALAGLQAEGLLQARQGDGIRVLDPAERGGLGLVPELIAAGRSELLGDLLALRRVMAAEAVVLACERATEADKIELKALSLLQQEELQAEAFLQRDLAFARTLVKAAHSLPLSLMLNAFAPLYRDHAKLAEALMHQAAAVRRSYVGVLSLVEQGAPPQAREVVRQTLEIIDGHTLAFLEAK